MPDRLRRLLDSVSLGEGAGTRGIQIFLASFAALYIEVLLIRWVGTEFRLFAYFQNLALIACFLGFGLGCLKSAKKPVHLFDFWALCLLVAIIEVPWRGWKRILELVGAGLSAHGDLEIWSRVTLTSEAWVKWFAAAFIAGVLLLIVQTMAPLGAWVGRLLGEAERPVTAYTQNLLGSLAGVWFFAGISFLRLGPVFWFGLAFFLLILMEHRTKRLRIAGFAAMVFCLGLLILGGRSQGKTVWSPYQKLEIIPHDENNYQINVNNAGYMSIANVTPAYLEQHPDLAAKYRARNSYDSPFRFVEKVGSVLVVGSGAGNDVAAALRHGAEHVDAIEIDPVIYGFGRDLHPERPYQSPKVRVVLDDARHFMRRARDRYDTIVFGLLDSHTQSANLSNMRIDNYVYTKESFEEAKRLLKPTGVLILKFEVHAPNEWIGQRFYTMLGQVFGRSPVTFFCPTVRALFSASVFLESQEPALWERASSPELAQFVAENPVPYKLAADAKVTVTRDDWPYVYQRDQTIPRIYLAVSAILLGIALLLVRKTIRYREASMWNFFLLGAGFLLLETQMVSRLALFFGSTWVVNCVALTVILLVLVAANAIVMKAEIARLAPYYGGVMLSLLAIYAVPWTRLPMGTRAGGVLLAMAYSVPLLFAGIIFTESFRRAKNRTESFGANILGAVAGGLAQNLSFLFGMKALLLFAVAFYGCAGIAGVFVQEISRDWAAASGRAET